MKCTPPASETLLIEQLAAGNRLAFEVVYGRYRKRVYTMAIQYLGCIEVAKDVCQDIFLKLWLKREVLVEVKNFEAFFFVMARHFILDFLKHQSRVTAIVWESTSDLPADASTPEAMLLLKQTEHKLMHAIAQLPVQQRTVFMLASHEGYTHREIGEQLAISVRTVSNHMTRALQRLRESVGEKKYT